MVNCINLIIEMSPRFILGRENVPRVAEVVNRSLKADCTNYKWGMTNHNVKTGDNETGHIYVVHHKYQVEHQLK